MRLLVFSDLRLDRDPASEGAEADHAARRGAHPWACLDRILGLADEHEVDAILCAGDLYDHRHVRPGTAGRLVERFGRVGRPVFLAPGDVDPHTPDSVYATTTWPADVHVFDHDLLVPVELADGVWLWGGAHLDHHGTPGFLDGFAVRDDDVHLALFHGSEVGAFAADGGPTVAPFRAEQVGAAGLAHAFVGHAATPVDGPRLTVPGVPVPRRWGDPAPRGAVVVDVAADGTVQRRRFDVATSRPHDASVEATSWSTDRLEVPRGPAVEPPAEDVAAARAPLFHDPVPAEPEPLPPVVAAAARPDLGGLSVEAVEAHLDVLRAPPVELDPALVAEVARLEATPVRRESRGRRLGRAAAMLVTVAAAVGLFLTSETTLQRLVPLVALVLVVVVARVTWRDTFVEHPDLEGAREQLRAAWLEGLARNGELTQLRHQSITALEGAGLPTDPVALAELVEAARGRGAEAPPVPPLFLAGDA